MYNQVKLGVVIVLIIFPLIFVHLANVETVPRLISIVMLFTILPGILLFSAVNPNEKPVSSAPRLRGKYSERILRKWDITVKVFVGVFIALIIYYMTVPLLWGTYRFAVGQKPLIVIEGSVMNQKSTLFGLAFIIWSFDLKENSDHYQFWYPNMIRSSGEEYRFTILPGTNFILNSEKIE